ncbi:Ig-like domain-containing protein, partial [Guyparkeria sp. 1SP6A2]|nr:Ig-like domain-containing protein [Guyparkeria sp. 1SP6A2]
YETNADLSELVDGNLDVTATVTDQAGNSAMATDTAVLDTVAEAGTVTVDDITEDDVINAAESDQTVTVTGTATGGDISVGDNVSMTINGQDYGATVGNDDTWSV